MLTLALVSLLAAAPTPLDQAHAAVNPFKKALKEALFKALEVSPESALEVCSTRAPQLAKEASSASVTVGRSAFKLRNPGNAPRPWLEKAMRELAAEKSGTETSRLVTLPDGTVGYAEPIWVVAPCLVCHGKTLAPGLEKQLTARYPNDTARGFELGDFRGVFWAELKPQKP
jgi:Protein of unknown function (DUF3365)